MCIYLFYICFRCVFRDFCPAQIRRLDEQDEQIIRIVAITLVVVVVVLLLVLFKPI